MSGPKAAAGIVEKAACRPGLGLARSSQTKTNDSPVKGPVLSATVVDTTPLTLKQEERLNVSLPRSRERLFGESSSRRDACCVAAFAAPKPGEKGEDLPDEPKAEDQSSPRQSELHSVFDGSRSMSKRKGEG